MTSGSPLALLAALSQGAAGPAAGGASAAPQSPLGQQVSQQLASVNGADPQMLMRQLQQWKAGIAGLIPHVAFRIPKMAPYLAQTLKGIDKSIEAAAEAATTAATVSAGMGVSPLGMSAASSMDASGQSAGGM